MTRGPIRYAQSDGLSIAFQVAGEGDRNIVFIPGFFSNLDLTPEFPGFRLFQERVERLGTVAYFDKRGQGLSDRQLGTGTLEERMDDVVAVMDAVGFDSADLVGLSEGAPLALLMAATNPDRVSSVSALGSLIRGPLKASARIEEREAWSVGFLEHIRDDWGKGTILGIFIEPDGDAPNLVDLRARFERMSASPQSAVDAMEANLHIDVRPVLPAVQAPTLMVHATGDTIASYRVAERAAASIPNCRFVRLDGDFHWSERPDVVQLYADEVERFLTGSDPIAAGTLDRFLATVLFTDLVSSTATAASLGDTAWNAVLGRHDEITRQAVERHRGRWIRGTGDGIVAIFDGPGRAIAAARNIRSQLEAMGLRIRAGLHTGEIHERGDDIGGLSVVVAQRVMDRAGNGEIWVSPTIPGLVVGSGLTFEERGIHELKGVPGEWALSAVG